MSRRLVAVLFLDLVDWTGLAESYDPELLQELLECYYDICGAAVEEHGGVVEKFIGDAVMAVFGAERAAEDDSLRAVRTGLAVRSAMANLQVAGHAGAPPKIHCGIAAGEASVSRSDRAGVRIVGDVVNLAARLQSVAEPDEVLVNDVMSRLIRKRAVVVPVPQLTLKGKREPVSAWRVLGIATATKAESSVTMVDRREEAGHLQSLSGQVLQTNRQHAVIVSGPAGVGKSCLVQDALEGFSRTNSSVTIATGTSPSYGTVGIYSALGQIVDALQTRVRSDQTTEGQLERARAVLARLPSDVGSGTGQNAHPAPGVEELRWAARVYLAAAASKPLVLVWEDVHWASPSLLRVIGSVADGLRDRPVLMVYVGREISESQLSTSVDEHLELGPLLKPDAIEFVSSMATRSSAAEVTAHSADLLDRIADSSGGNPLFAELLMETVSLGGRLDEVPPSVTAVVGEVLDRLTDSQRRIVEAASVVGPTFHLEQIAHLDVDVSAPAVDELSARQLIERGDQADEFRFAQQLVHEVVYGRLAKQQRLSWHRRLAELEIAAGFHLESAARLLRDLRPNDPELEELEIQAAVRLHADGTEALRRRDLPAAVGMLRRALALTPAQQAEQQTLAAIRLSDALLLSGDLSQAQAEGVDLLGASPSPRARRAGQLQRCIVAMRAGRDVEETPERLKSELLSDLDDHVGWCRFYQVDMLQHLANGRFRAAENAVSSALAHGEAMEDAYELDRLLAARCEIGQWSPTPIPEKLATCHRLLERFSGDRVLLLPILTSMARSLALSDELDAARNALDEGREIVEELQLTTGRILVAQVSGLLDSVVGDSDGAMHHFVAAQEAAETTGLTTVALTMRVLAERERMTSSGVSSDAAAVVADLASKRDHTDMRGQVFITSLSARVAAASGADPRSLIDDVHNMLERTDDPCLHGDALLDVAAAYGHFGGTTEYRLAVDQACEQYAAVGATALLRKGLEW